MAYRSAWIASTALCALLAPGCRGKQERATRATTPSATAAIGGPGASASVAALEAAQSPPQGARDPAVASRSATPSSDPAAASAPTAPGPSAAPSASASAARVVLRGPELDLGATTVFAASASVIVVQTSEEQLGVVASREGRPQQLPEGTKAMGSAAPALLDDEGGARAYFVSRGRLVRRRIAADGSLGPLEVLASDAADYTRVAAAHAPGPKAADVVVYIGQRVSKEMERGARVWVEARGAQPATPEGAGATSVDVVSLGGGRLALLSLDGRMSMSPVHARYLELDAAGAPHLGEDRVVFVAGPAEQHTEIAGVRIGMGPAALLAIGRDVSSFGLLALQVGFGEGEAPSSWTPYPNGITPAPVAAALVCGRPVVAWAMPETKDGGSRKLLQVGTLDREGRVGAAQTLASAAAIKRVALAPVRAAGAPSLADSGVPVAAWVVYSADGRVRALGVGCP